MMNIGKLKDWIFEYKKDSYVALYYDNFISAGNGGTGTPEDSNIKQKMIIEQEKNMTPMKALRMSQCLKTTLYLDSRR